MVTDETMNAVLRPTADEPAKREEAIRQRYAKRRDTLKEVLGSARAWERLRAMSQRRPS